MSLAKPPDFGAEALRVPASASAQAPGSASAASAAGVVELCPARAMGPAELRDALAADPAVTKVVHKSTKTSQGGAGSQHTDFSLIVYVAGFPSKPVEFELALHQELCTATACFKPPPEGVEAVAWQILMRVVEGRELMPVWARPYARAAVERVKQRLAAEADVEDVCDAEPGSASHSEPPLKKHKPHAD